jgi:hypothetical protein
MRKPKHKAKFNADRIEIKIYSANRGKPDYIGKAEINDYTHLAFMFSILEKYGVEFEKIKEHLERKPYNWFS